MAYTKVTTTLVDTLNRNTTGSAATLTTARTIGGTSFDGSANIAVGTATEATNITAAANNSADETVYPTFVDGATGTQGLETDTGFTYNPSSGNLTTTGQLGGATLSLSGNATVGGNLTVTGTSTVVDTVTMNAQNAIVFEGATADNYETTLSIVDPTADHTQYLINQTGYIPVLAAATTVAISATPAELNILDGVTSTAAELNLLDGVSGLVQADFTKLAAVDSTAAEINLLDGLDRGSILYGNSSSATTVLGQGSADQVLTSDGTDISWEDASSFDADAAQVFNESGASVDFRVESNSDANAIFVDGSADSVGIGTATPADKLHVVGDIRIDGGNQMTNEIAWFNSSHYLAGIRQASHGSYNDSGGLQFLTSGTSNAAESVKMVIDTQGKVGIGTTSPGALLHLYNSSNAQITFQNSTTGTSVGSDGYDITVQGNDAYHILRDSGFQTWYTANTRRMTLDSGGKLGIGTATPGSYNDYADNLVLANTGGNVGMTFASSTSGYGSIRWADGTSDPADSQGIIDYNHSTNAFRFFTANAESMRIDSNKNVRIAETSKTHHGDYVGYYLPNGGLLTDEAAGAGKYVSLSQNAYINTSNQWAYNQTDETALFQMGNGTFLFYNAASGSADAAISFNARMSLNADGDLIVGSSTAGAAGSLTLYKESNFVTINNDTTSSAGNGSEWQVFRRAGTQIGSIVMNGTTGTTYGTSSDYRLKENVDYSWNATTRLKQLKPARFNWISDETNTLQDGFLAHEVSSIVPEAITGDKDAMETYTDDGVEKTRIKPQGIDQSKLVPLLVKAIQELEARLEVLEG